MKKWSCFVLLGFIFFPTMAQVQENLRVVYKDLRVYVTDGADTPVKGLKKDDFEISQGGRAIDVSYFEEVVSSAKAEPAEDPEMSMDRTFLVVMDTGMMYGNRFLEMKLALKRFVKKHLRPNDQIKFLQLELSLEDRSPFLKGSQEKQILAVIENAPYSGSVLRLMRQKERQVDDERDFVQDMGGEFSHLFMSSVSTLDRGLDEFKEAHYHLFYRALLASALMLEPMTGEKHVLLFTGGAYSPDGIQGGRKLASPDRLAWAFQKAGAELHAMNLTPPKVSGMGVEVRYAGEDGESSDQGAPNPGNMAFQDNTMAYASSSSGPLAAAKASGGTYFQGSGPSKMQRRLKLIDRRASHHYHFGFRVDSAAKGKLKIKLKDPKRSWRVRFSDPRRSPMDLSELDKHERDVALTIALRYGHVARDDLLMRWALQPRREEDGRYTIRVIGEPRMPGDHDEPLYFGLGLLDADGQLIGTTTGKRVLTMHQGAALMKAAVSASSRPSVVRLYVVKGSQVGFHELEIGATE